MINQKILSTLIQVVIAFEELGIDYYVGGSVAGLTYGVYRTTADVDVIADMRLEHVPLLVELLKDEYYLDADMMKEAIKRHSEFSLLHFKTMFKVDVFIQKKRLYDLEVRSRVQEGTLGDTDDDYPFLVESAEDVILTKMEWYKMGGGVSDRQWGDIVKILDILRNSIDIGYLRKWAMHLGIGDLLERALSEAGLV